MERRTYATFKKQWPGPTGGEGVDILVTSPDIDFDNYFTPEFSRDLVISIFCSFYAFPLLPFFFSSPIDFLSSPYLPFAQLPHFPFSFILVPL